MQLRAFYTLLVLVLFGTTAVIAQDLKFPDLDASPMDAAHYPRRAAFQNYLSDDDPDRTQYIKVLYCRPNKKDREIFGGLVPWGKDWRLGANEATEVTFYRPVAIGGTTLKPGTYTMFAQPYPNQWILKISEQRHIAGTDNRDITKDVVTVSVPTEMVPNVREAFTIGFAKVDDGHCDMVFEWDQTRVRLLIDLNPPAMADSNVSPMDLVQYPNNSRFQNFLKPEELKDADPKVRVVYSRPQMKGRKIFGELLEYGKVWRVGANETTILTLFEDATIGGKKLKAGQYGLFAKVDKDNWEFIIHKNVQSWGPANHDDKNNVVTVMAKAEKTPKTVEVLSVLLEKNGDKGIDLIVAWENTMARLPIVMD